MTLELNVEANYEKIDDRRNKHYGKKVTLNVFLLAPDAHDEPNERDCGHFHPISHFSSLARPPLERPNNQVAINLSFRHHSDKYWQVSVIQMFASDRPSLTLSDTEARQAMNLTDEQIKEAITNAYDQTADAYKNATYNVQSTKQAAHVLLFIENKLLDAAKDDIRFTQRLAALTAELDAEVKVKAKSLVEDTAEKMIEEKWLERSRLLVQEHGLEWIKQCKFTGLPGRPGSPSNREESLRKWLQAKIDSSGL